MGNDGKLSAIMAAWETPFPPTEKLVLVCLVQHINPKTATAWPSVSRLCRLTGLGNRTVQRALARLESAGAITRVDRPGRVTEYRHHLTRTALGTGETPATVTGDPRHSGTTPPSQ